MEGKIEIGDVVEVRQKQQWHYGKVTSFYEYGLFVQPRNDMEPICFSWNANEIRVIESNKQE